MADLAADTLRFVEESLRAGLIRIRYIRAHAPTSTFLCLGSAALRGPSVLRKSCEPQRTPLPPPQGLLLRQE